MRTTWSRYIFPCRFMFLVNVSGERQKQSLVQSLFPVIFALSNLIFAKTPGKHRYAFSTESRRAVGGRRGNRITIYMFFFVISLREATFLDVKVGVPGYGR